MSDRDIVSSAMAEELDGRIEQAGGDNLIQTMRGIGYKLVDESR